MRTSGGCIGLSIGGLKAQRLLADAAAAHHALQAHKRSTADEEYVGRVDKR